MHGVRESVLDEQVAALGLPCRKIGIPSPCTNEIYELRDLPAGVDHCGENGEFHTFVTKGPMFARSIDCKLGEVVERDGFVFADLRR
jgi:diphthamide synthase (EF-2-diphthine--ammonia ligase)